MTLIFLAILLLVVLITLGIPVAYCFAGAVFFLSIFVPNISIKGLLIYSINQLKSPTLLAIPLFILVGGLMSTGKIAEALLGFVEVFVGKIKGGLGVVAVITCGIIGAISGSGFTGLATIGPIMIPHMVKANYPKNYATALITCSSLLGILIPPSLGMILFGWATNTSILACFLATVGPGILIIILFSIINFFVIRKIPLSNINSQDSIATKKKEALKKILYAIPAFVVPIIILGGIYGGVFTPTEAAAVAAVIVIPIDMLAYRGLTLKSIYDTIRDSATSVGSIAIVIFFGIILSQIFVFMGASHTLVNYMMGISENKYIILLLINILLIIVGMLISDSVGILVFSPLLLPIMKEIGVSPVQFAAIICTNLTMGNVTPPYANILYLGMRIGKVENLSEIMKPLSILLFFGYIPVLLLTTYWPDLSLFLPRLFGLIP